MYEFPPINKFNSFREKNIFCKDDEKKKALLSINKNSLFLKKVIESKNRERYSSKRILDNKIEKSNKRAQKNSYDNNNRIYQSPINTQKFINTSKNEINNNRCELYLDNYLKNNKLNNNSNIDLTSFVNRKSANSSRISKLSINKLTRGFLSPNNYINKSCTFNFDSENDSNCLIFKGKKMFSSSTFKNLSSSIIPNSPKNINENSSELYRNYSQLKLKQEEIYKRKIKKSISAKKRKIFEIEKDKEIKEQTIDFNHKKEKKYNLIKKIPIGKKIKYFILRNNNENKENISDNIILKDLISPKSNNHRRILKTSIDNILYKEKNIIIDNKIIQKNNMNFLSNNHNYINDIKNSLKRYLSNTNENKNIIKKLVKNNNPNYIKKHYEKLKIINLNKKNKLAKSLTPDRLKLPKNINNKKKYIEDQLNDYQIISKDNKLIIRMHSLQNINQFFLMKRKNKQKLKVQKQMNIYLTNNIDLYLNYLVNNDKKCKIKKNKNILSAIKEEEEKSKAEIAINESQLEDKNNNKKKTINDLKKIILMPNDI